MNGARGWPLPDGAPFAVAAIETDGEKSAQGIRDAQSGQACLRQGAARRERVEAVDQRGDARALAMADKRRSFARRPTPGKKAASGLPFFRIVGYNVGVDGPASNVVIETRLLAPPTQAMKTAKRNGVQAFENKRL